MYTFATNNSWHRCLSAVVSLEQRVARENINGVTKDHPVFWIREISLHKHSACVLHTLIKHSHVPVIICISHCNISHNVKLEV